MKDKWTFRQNSFDLIRLLAAAQVVILHSFEFMMPEVTRSTFFEVLRLIPGVPIFFFISGMLISRSYERAPSLADYGRNRALRIYPALVVCVFFNLLMVWSTGYFQEQNVSLTDASVLFLAKSSFIQFYNPDYMREFGDGVLNGSLWTICVELQFYLLVPFFYAFLKSLRYNSNFILLGAIIIGVMANRFLYLSASEYGDTVLWKLYRVSFLPWVYMFLTGVFFQRNFDIIAANVSSIPMGWFAIGYFAVMYLLSGHGLHFGNSIPPYIFFPLALLVFRFAYFAPGVSNNLLKGNDISYGIYIWHMPLVNQLLYFRSDFRTEDVMLVIVASIMIAWLSWVLIERNAMKLKKFSLKTLVETRAPL